MIAEINHVDITAAIDRHFFGPTGLELGPRLQVPSEQLRRRRFSGVGPHNKGVGGFVAVIAGDGHGCGHRAKTGRAKGDANGAGVPTANRQRRRRAEAKGGVATNGDGKVGEIGAAEVMDRKGAHLRTARRQIAKVGVIAAGGGGVPTDNDNALPRQLNFGNGGACAKFLDAMVVGVSDKDVAAWIDRHTIGCVQLPQPLAGAAPLGEKGAAAGKFLDAVVVGVGHIEIATAIDHHVAGGIELPSATPPGAPLGQIETVAVKFLNAVILGVRHINIAAAIDGNPSGILQLAGAAAVCAPLGEKVAAAVKLLDAVVEVIDHIEVAAAIDRDIAG